MILSPVWLRSSLGRRSTALRTRLNLELLERRTLLSVDPVLTIEGTSQANSSCSCTPPDPSGAAGPSQIIETTNNAIAFYDKATGGLIRRQSLTSFFGQGLSGVQRLGDPVVMYDDIAGQFVVAELEFTTQRHFDVAVSFDSDIADGFFFVRYDINAGADFPRAGFNADAWVFSFNQFSGTTHVDTLRIDKNSLTGFVSTAPGGHFTMTPATMHGANPGDPMWFVERGTSGANSTIRVIQMTNVLSSNPTLRTTSISVPSYGSPPRAAQPGDTLPASTATRGLGDTRILNADYVGGLLVAGHTIGSGGLARARWYEFDTTGSLPSLVQSGTIDQGPGVHTYYPTVALNSEADIGMTFMESSSSEFLSMYVTGQSVNDFGAGTMQTPVVTHPGTSFYSSGRIGDYSGITADPADGYTFWATNEYKRNSTWNTGIAAFGVSPDTSAPSRALPGRGLLAARASAAAALASGSSLFETESQSVGDSRVTSSKRRAAAVLVDGLFGGLVRKDLANSTSGHALHSADADSRLAIFDDVI
jgi:hypothetical protein